MPCSDQAAATLRAHLTAVDDGCRTVGLLGCASAAHRSALFIGLLFIGLSRGCHLAATPIVVPQLAGQLVAAGAVGGAGGVGSTGMGG